MDCTDKNMGYDMDKHQIDEIINCNHTTLYPIKEIAVSDNESYIYFHDDNLDVYRIKSDKKDNSTHAKVEQVGKIDMLGNIIEYK